MGQRKTTPSEIETRVLVSSGRRCCLCFGLRGDFDEKQGQIAHLDRDPSNFEFDNLAYLCLDHHDIYDSRTSQSKGMTINEVEEHRTQLYQAIAQNLRGAWAVGVDVPILDFYRPLPSTGGIPGPGMQFVDKDPSSLGSPPVLYLSLYYKTSRYFSSLGLPAGEKWLYFEANMRFAFNLRIQVRAWNNRDVLELMEFLRTDWTRPPLINLSRGIDLHGPRPENSEYQSGDYFLIWREDGENRVMMSTFSPSNAGISIHARLSDRATAGLADYLEQVGYAEPLGE